MKSSGQRKRKVSEVSQENRTGAVVKNSASRNSNRRRKPAGEYIPLLPVDDPKKKPSTTAQLTGKTTKVVSRSNMETTKVLDFKVQTGETLTSSKIKLQLFPLNSTTQVNLEKDGHNPFLELTLSARKKVASVIKHLNAKWGCSSAALGELMLFPYDARLDNIASCRRWTSDCGSYTAGELHEALETPTVFRLKYGWFSNLHEKDSGVSCSSTSVEERSDSFIGEDCNVFSRMTHNQLKKINAANQGIRNPINMHEEEDIAWTEQMPPPVPVHHLGDDIRAHSIISWDDSLTSLSIGGLLSEASLLNKINNNTQKSESKSNLQPIELVSDISIGALLSEASLLDKFNTLEQRSYNFLSLQPTQQVSDSCTRDMLSGVFSQCKIDNLDLKAENETGFQPIYSASEVSIGGLLSEASLQGKISAFDTTSSRQGLKGASQFLFPWDDSLTSLSIGGLLSEASLQGRVNGCDPNSKQNTSSLYSKSLALDSSEAFVAAQTNLHTQAPKSPIPHSFSSILDAEETCHAFSFKKFSSSGNESLTFDGKDESRGCWIASKSRTSTTTHRNELNNKTKLANDPADQKPMTDPLPHPQGVV